MAVDGIVARQMFCEVDVSEHAGTLMNPELGLRLGGPKAWSDALSRARPSLETIPAVLGSELLLEHYSYNTSFREFARCAAIFDAASRELQILKI